MDRAIKKNIGTVALCFFEYSVVQDPWIGVFVVGSIPPTSWIGLADSTGSVNEGFFEATSLGLIEVFVPQVPFSKDSGAVVGLSEYLCDGHRVESKSFAFEDGMGHTIEEFMSTGHQGAAGRSAGRRDIKVLKGASFVFKAIQVWSF